MGANEVVLPPGFVLDAPLPAGFVLDGAPKAKPMSRAERFGKGLRDPVDAGAQLLTQMLPSGVVSAGNRLNNWLAEKTGLVGALPEGGVDQQVRENEAAYQAKRGEGFDGMRVLGNVLNPVNLAIAARAPQAVTLAGRMGVGAVGGAVSGALNPVTTEGDFATEKAKQIGIGGAFGGGVPLVTGAAARVVMPKAATNPNVQMLRREGVTPTMGQALGGAANTMEQKLAVLPVVGDAISASRRSAVEDFNRAAINRALAPIGSKTTATGHDAVREAGDAIGQVYNNGRSMLGNFFVDPQTAQQLQTVRTMANQLPRREQRAFNEVWQKYQTELTPQGGLLQDGYQRLREHLGKRAAEFGSSTGDAYQRQLGDAIRQMDLALEQAARRANPKAAAMLDSADAAYANLVRVEGAAKAAKRTDGVFTPGQLLGGVQAADRSVRDRATSRGTALMQDLGRAGQDVLGNTVPDSGTTGRMLAALATTGGLGAIGTPYAAGLLGLGAMYTPAMQKVMSSAVSARPQLAQPVADALRQASPALIPLGSQIGLGLLN